MTSWPGSLPEILPVDEGKAVMKTGLAGAADLAPVYVLIQHGGTYPKHEVQIRGVFNCLTSALVRGWRCVLQHVCLEPEPPVWFMGKGVRGLLSHGQGGHNYSVQEWQPGTDTPSRVWYLGWVPPTTEWQYTDVLNQLLRQKLEDRIERMDCWYACLFKGVVPEELQHMVVVERQLSPCASLDDVGDWEEGVM